MKKLSYIFILFGLFFKGQNAISYSLNNRIDTSKAEIKEIVNLWINYLGSNPDSTNNNPCWNESEKKKYKKFDFTAPMLFQFPSTELLNYYKPTVLSVEKEGSYYAIRTLFYAEGLEGYYKRSNPWSITKLFATKENGKWKLINALPVITESWNHKKVGKITFIYHDGHKFNLKLSKRSNKFCDSVAKVLQLLPWKPFDYYITESADELGKLFGFDFFFAGYTTGVGDPDNRMLFCGKDSEWYPHELVHMIVPNTANIHEMVSEGIASWFAGFGGKSLTENLKEFASAISRADTIEFKDISNGSWGWQYGSDYCLGAIMCKVAYEKDGATAFKKLIEVPKNDDVALINTFCKILGINRNEFEEFWRKETLKYL